MRIGFTGTQQEITQAQLMAGGQLFDLFEREANEFHHGCCIGADATAAMTVSVKWPICEIIGHPPTDRKKVSLIGQSICDTLRKPLPYLDRNKAIVLESDILIACPKGEEELRSGTWSTVRFARKLHRPIYIVCPDGTITEENMNAKT